MSDSSLPEKSLHAKYDFLLYPFFPAADCTWYFIIRFFRFARTPNFILVFCMLFQMMCKDANRILTLFVIHITCMESVPGIFPALLREELLCKFFHISHKQMRVDFLYLLVRQRQLPTGPRKQRHNVLFLVIDLCK